MLITCFLSPGVCINCPLVVDSKDPELLALLRQVMDEYNFNSNHTELYDVTHIEHAIRKVSTDILNFIFHLDSPFPYAL